MRTKACFARANRCTHGVGVVALAQGLCACARPLLQCRLGFSGVWRWRRLSKCDSIIVRSINVAAYVRYLLLYYAESALASTESALPWPAIAFCVGREMGALDEVGT